MVPLVTAMVATPAAIRAAFNFNFLDRPTGWKSHARPTPYLGGAAVMAAFTVGLVAAGTEPSKSFPLAAIALVMWGVGTIDDRRGVPWFARVALEMLAGAALWALGLGWSVFSSDVLNLALSMAWILAVVNALNMLDLMDGVASTVAAVSAAGAGALAALQGDELVAATAFSLSGACLGFLPYNLRRPARIFLGDGGSMPIGFVIGAVMMVIPSGAAGGISIFLTAGVLVGFPLLDMGFRIVSRLRRRASLLVPGEDSLANYLKGSLGDARSVALCLGAIQGGLCLTAIGALELGQGSVVAAWAIWFGIGSVAVAFLEGRLWREGNLVVSSTAAAKHVKEPSVNRSGVSLTEAVLIAFMAISCGLSPFFYGFYDLSVWGPISLLLLAGLLGLVLARPERLRRSALLALAGLCVLWLWSLVSIAWSESADQALVEANRWMLYAACFGLFALLLRDDRLSRVLMVAATGAIAALALYLVAVMALGSAGELFLGARLHEPLGYINGQVGYLLLGFWPLVAMAEVTKRPWLAGAGLGGATLLAGVAVLGQSRAVIPAVVLSAFILIAFLPGRAKRLWILLVIGLGLGLALDELLNVYDSAGGTGEPSADALRSASSALVVASALAGIVWAVCSSGWNRARAGGSLPRGTARAIRALPLAAWAAVCLVAVSVVDRPIDRVERGYQSFVGLGSITGDSTRFTSAGGNRYDYWRVAATQFSREPLRGVGAGNYDRTYYVERRNPENIRQPHSIELQAAAELGVVGIAGLALFLIAVVAGFVRRARAARHSAAQRSLAVAAGGTFAIWLLHTSVDWLHLIPGVTGLALASAAVLTGPWGVRAASARSRRLAMLGCAALVLLAAALVGRSALAERYRAEAHGLVRKEPVEAVNKADRSLALNDEALPTYYVMAAAYARLDDYRSARGVLLQATRREPHDFVSWGLLGDLAVRRGDLRQARRDYGRAVRLNPRDPTLRSLAASPQNAIGDTR